MIRLTDIVNTCVAALCHSQDHPGSVPIPTLYMTTGPASEDSFTEPEALLGSRETPRTRHARVRGPHQHHLPAGPHAPFDQLSLRAADRSIGGLTRHRRPGQDRRREVLHRDQSVAVNNPLRPHPRIMFGLSGRLLLQPRGLPPRPPVALGLGAPLSGVAAGHCPLRLRQLRRTPLPVAEIRQVEGGVGGGGRGRHTPVDADPTRRFRDRWNVASDDERGVPVAERIPGDLDTRRLRRQLPRPHHRNGNAFRQNQPTVVDPESTTRELQRQRCLLAGFECRPTTTLQRERLIKRPRIRAQHLLLRDLRSLPKPGVTRPRLRQHLRQGSECRPCARLLLVDGLVPQESAPIPLRNQGVLRLSAGPEPERVPNDLFPHARQRIGDPRQIGGWRFHSPVNEGVSAPNI